MKKHPTKKRILMTISHLLLAVTICLLLFQSIGYKRDSPTIQGATYVKSAAVSVGGNPAQRVSLPCNVENLAPRTPVTLTATITPNQDDGVYVKTVYAPAKVYLDDTLVFELGKRKNYPKFMTDPATEIHVIETHGTGEPMKLRIEYQSPTARSTLALHCPIVGTSKELLMERSYQFGLPMILSMVQFLSGVALLLISFCVMIIDKKGVLFLWLGLFSMASGMWSFGENNLSVTIFPDSAALYLLSFIGFFTFIIPLLHFTRTIIGFHNPKPLWYMELFFTVSAGIALLLQLFALVPCYKSMYFFHAALPVALVLIAAMTLWDCVRYRNTDARRFVLPISILAVTAILELLNYNFPVTYAFSSLFQLGILIFLLIIGVTAGMYIKDSIDLQNQQKALNMERNILEIQTEEQKKAGLILAQNEQLLSTQRHDLRHHLTAIQELVPPDRDHEKLRQYLNTLIDAIPRSKERFCQNDVVNAIVSHYHSLCEASGIALSMHLDVPTESKLVADSDLCVIFANLLENAIEACGRMTEGEKFIKLQSTLQYELLTITMDNSFNGTVSIEGGKFFSSKRNDFGIGLRSIQSIAQKTGGDAEFETEGTVFLSSVYMRV